MDSNYDVAVDLVRRLFANQSVIQHAHISWPIFISPIYNEDGVNRLRFF